MKKTILEKTKEQTSKRLTAFIVAVVFVIGTVFVPTGTLAAETEEAEAAANAQLEDLVVAHDENGSAALEDLDEGKYDGFIYKLREDVTKKEVREMEAAIDELGEDSAAGAVAPVIDKELYTADSIETIEEVADADMIEYIEPDYTISLLGTNDLYYDEFGWFLEMIKVPYVWEKGEFGEGITVAVIDSGVMMNHPDFENTKFADPYNAMNDSADVTDSVGHGTGVAGIIAASYNNKRGLTGVMPQVTVMPVKAVNGFTSGTYSKVIKGIHYAADHGADVINISLGDTTDSEALHEACDQAAAKCVILVAAAGNDGENSIYYPASYNSVVSVGSIERDGEHSDFSTYNEYIDAVAPGRGILFPSKLDTIVGYFTSYGTSYTAPQVAAMAAMVKKTDRSVDITGFRDILKHSCIDKGKTGRDDYFGYGLIDLDRAYRYMTETFSMYTASLSSTLYAYDEKAKKPSVTLKKGNRTMPAYDYKVIYPSGRREIGTYKVTIKGQGIYSGTKTKKFIIRPPLVKKLKELTPDKTRMKVKWYAMTDEQEDRYTGRITGFQVRISTSPKFTNARYIRIKGISRTSMTVKNLKRKTTYYVQYRAYKHLGTKNYISVWSNTLKAKTK